MHPAAVECRVPELFTGGAREVLPFVMKGRADFALISNMEGCVQWPRHAE